ncbi:MAG: histidine kinase [Burkholderiales bacterium]|nr:histidine kinase [Burkholderiales bacterium]
MLRVVLFVNLGMLLAALVTAESTRAWLYSIPDLALFVEPYLFLEVLTLWAAGPTLSKLTLPWTLAAITAVTLVCGVIVGWLTGVFFDGGTAKLLLWGLIAQALVLYYFSMRDRILSPALTEAKLQALQARIRPHFLFNSINAVMSIIRYDPKQAESALQDLADLFRTLMRDNLDLVPLASEIKLCRQYLGIEKLRLGDRLNVEWAQKAMPEDALIPPLIIQPLIENAVHHGIESSPKGGTVSINIYLIRGELRAVVKNPYNPRAREHKSGNKIALDNIRARLALHYDAEARLESVIVNEYYEVRIRLPYHPQNTDSYQPLDTINPFDEARRHKEAS